MALDARPGPRLTFSSPRQIGSPQPRAAISRPTLRSILPRRLGRSPLRPGLDDLLAGPIRGELLGAEHLAERARTRGARPSASRRKPRPPARPRCWSGWTRPAASWTTPTPGWPPPRTAMSTSARPASGCWTTIHVVQEHIGEVRESLPSGYYRELPELAAGPLAGYPRVYELAITLISHTEGRVELENVDRLRRRLPGGRAAHHRRAVGRPGDAPAGPDRERPPHGAPHGPAARRARGGGRLGRAGSPTPATASRQRARPRRSTVRRRPAAAHADLRLPLPRSSSALRGRRAPAAGPAGAVDRRARR